MAYNRPCISVIDSRDALSGVSRYQDYIVAGGGKRLYLVRLAALILYVTIMWHRKQYKGPVKTKPAKTLKNVAVSAAFYYDNISQ